MDDVGHGRPHVRPLGAVRVVRYGLLARLDDDLRVRDARRDELAQGAEPEVVPVAQRLRAAARGGAAREHPRLELLERGVLQHGIRHEHERGPDALPQRAHAVLLDDAAERREEREAAQDGGGRALARAPRRAHRLARVDDPDRVAGDRRRGAGEEPGHDALERRERAEGRGRRAREALGREDKVARRLEEEVVHKVAHANAEERRPEAVVQAEQPLLGEDRADGLDQRLAGLPRAVHRRARRNCHQGVRRGHGHEAARAARTRMHQRLAHHGSRRGRGGGGGKRAPGQELTQADTRRSGAARPHPRP